MKTNKIEYVIEQAKRYGHHSRIKNLARKIKETKYGEDNIFALNTFGIISYEKNLYLKGSNFSYLRFYQKPLRDLFTRIKTYEFHFDSDNDNKYQLIICLDNGLWKFSEIDESNCYFYLKNRNQAWKFYNKFKLHPDFEILNKLGKLTVNSFLSEGNY
jgi:hypothetical protein